MLKSKLQEYSHSKKWPLPEYTTFKEGPDHCPLFKAQVTVDGVSFMTPEFSKTAKDAQIQAAKLALDYFTGYSSLRTGLPIAASSCSSLQVGSQPVCQTAPFGGLSVTALDHKMFEEPARLYKSALQVYTQKRKLPLPEYANVREGPPHASRFKSRVIVGGANYESAGYFRSLKEAENSAAKAALSSVSPDEVQQDTYKFYKNLLQEFVWKEDSALPIYRTIRSGASHLPKFVSTVEAGGEVYQGHEAKTRKLAEHSAAKVAYTAIKERRCKGSPGSDVKYVAEASPAKMQREGFDDRSRGAKSDAQQSLESSTVYEQRAKYSEDAGVHGNAVLSVSDVSAAVPLQASLPSESMINEGPLFARPVDLSSYSAEEATAEVEAELEGPPCSKRKLMN